MITRQYIRDNAPAAGVVFTSEYFGAEHRRKVQQVLQGMVEADMAARLEPNHYTMVARPPKLQGLTHLLLEKIPHGRDFTYHDLTPVIEGTRYSVIYLQATLSYMAGAGHLKVVSRRPRTYALAGAVSKPIQEVIDLAPGNAFLYGGLMR
jgi:hypothetical protein